MNVRFLLFFLTFIGLVFRTQAAPAQTYQPSNRTPVADNTLGTQVSGSGNNFNITGGINKGQTLFHSFTDFSIPTNGAANFLNPVGNRDIITRVTGTAFSDINGLLNSNGANFFLINPNGITFGTNARLNVGKAFMGSTANSLDLVDAGGRTITFGTNPNGDAPLLSVAPNVLFNASRLNFSGSNGAINNFGTLQTPNNSQYIGLMGGNVTLDGSSGGGKIVASGGRVDIGGLSGAGSVTVDNNGLVFSSVGVGRSNVALTDGAGITVRATGTLDTVNTFFNNAAANGSSINISANNLALLNAGGISATLPAAIDAGLETNSGVQTKAAGNINIDATGKVSLNNSAIKNTLRSGAEGSIGDVNIQAGAVDVSNNSFISTTLLGKGNAGNVTVTAKDAVSLTDDSGIFSSIAAGGVGKGGTIELNAGSLSIVSGAKLATNTDGASATQVAGQGNAGNVTVKVTGAMDIAGNNGTSTTGIFSYVDTATTGNSGNIAIAAGSVSLTNGAQLSAGTYGTGNAGNITVAAKNAVTLANGDILSTVEAGGVGKGGTIAIDAGSLSITKGGQLGTDTRAASTSQPAGIGDAGDITVKVSGAIDIAGNNGTSNSGIFSSVDTGTKGNGGNISIAANSFSLGDGALLKASTSGMGNAGNVIVTAKDTVSLTGYSNVFSTVEVGGVGKSGTVDISASTVSLKDGATVEASTYGTGNAGNVVVTAKDAVSLSNAQIFSAVESGGVGNSGTIAIDAGSLSITKGGQLGTGTRAASKTQPAGQGDAGDITVKVSGAVDIAGNNGKSNSGILSYVDTGTKGNGGNISIAANSFSLSDGALLKASTFGMGNAGNVTVTAKDTVSLTGYSNVFSTVEVGGVGKSGTVDISASTVSLKDGATVEASTYGTGNAGNVVVTAKDAVSLNNAQILSTVAPGTKGNGGNISIAAGAVSLKDGAAIEASTYGTGNAGNVVVTAKDAVSLSNAQIFSAVESGGVGNSGTIAIDAGSLSITKGGQLGTGTRAASKTQPAGQGDAGDITVKVSGAVDIAGNNGKSNSGILSYVDTGTKGNGGNISIAANSFSLSDGALLKASTFGMGNAGNVTVTAKDTVFLTGSKIFSTVEAGGVGKGGNISIAAGAVSIKDGAIVEASTYGTGNAGNVAVKAKEAVSLSDGKIFSVVEAGGVGNSGTIDISAGTVSLKDGAQLETITRAASATQPAGAGDAGNVTLKVAGAVDIAGNNGAFVSGIRSEVETGTTGNGGNISIDAGAFSLKDGAVLVGSTYGKGNAGNVSVTAKEAVSLSNGRIFSVVESGGVGKGGTIDISASSVSLKDGAQLQTLTRAASATQPAGAGDAGNVTLKVAGAVDIAGSNDTFVSGIRSEVETGTTGNGGNISIDAGSVSLKDGASLVGSTYGTGNAGKITIETTGKLSLSNQASILSTIEKTAIGNSEGIKISAGEFELANNSRINTSTLGIGNAGNIEIVTAGKYTADDRSTILAVTASEGDAGNITLNAKSVTLSAGAEIIPQSVGKGKAGNLTVTTPRDGFITITGTAPSGKLSDGNQGGFSSGLFATAEKDSSNVAGKISLTTGTLNIDNGGAISTRTRTNTAPIQPNNPQSSIVDGKYPQEPGAGSIFIDANNLNITGGGQILTTSTGNAPAGDVILKNAGTNLVIAGNDPSYEQRKAALIAASPDNPNAVAAIDPISQYSGIFANNGLGASGKGGTILLNPFSVKIADGGQISVNNQGTGEGGNIFLVSNLVTLNNGKITADSANTTGGNINLTTTDYLLLRNGSGISTNSGSSGKNGNGGNITISSPSVIALPGNNDITANAYNGAGGQVNITSQGLFGIGYRAQGSPSTNDITASSTFGQSGAVKITTPGTDPGRDSTELPKVTTDASNQISQVCGANNRQNKLTVAGRGGLPPNANDPLTSDVVWQDARAVSSQPAVSSVTTPVKFAPPAVGWVFDGKGKVTLVAAGTQGEPTGTSVVCPPSTP